MRRHKGKTPAMLRKALPLFVAAITATAGEPPISPEARKEMAASFEAQKKAADAVLEGDSKSPDALTRRGDARLFLGDAKGAVADFEKEIALDPSRDAPHWRLGIAYLFAGEHGKSARQFEKYHAYDNRDRENGVWQFLANARVAGIEKARTAMLLYTKFDREPFPSLYEMFAGKMTGDELLAEMEKKGIGDRPLVMFFAHYYIGLNDDLLGKKESAIAHLAKAVTLATKARAGGGAGYMGTVALLHYEQIAGRK